MYPQRRRLPLKAKLYEYLTTDVREDLLLEAEMLVLSFATGLGDATTYSEYRVFTANHTGNTILLAVGITEDSSGRPPVNAIPIPLPLIGISLSMFILGCWIPGQLGHLIGCRQRWWLMLNNFFQMLLVLAASMLQLRYLGWNSGPRLGNMVIDRTSMCVVALLAFSAGGQVSLARSLRMTEITTANATSAYIDMLIDDNLFNPYNRSRNRRLCFLFTLCAGAFSGGFAYQKFGSSTTLFISSVGKTLVTIMFLFNKGGYFRKACGCMDEKDGDSIMSDRTKCEEFDYGQPRHSPSLEMLSSRDSIPRYMMGTYLDLTGNHICVQIPSWALTAGKYVHRYLPGI